MLLQPVPLCQGRKIGEQVATIVDGVSKLTHLEFETKAEAQAENFQKSMAEYALGALTNKKNKAAFFNFALSITKDCDCFGDADMPIMASDIGIFASTDPVALDKATLDALHDHSTSTIPKLLGNPRLNPNYQLDHAQAIGLGTTDYELVNVP